MNRRIFTSLLVIMMALSAMGGATVAWFTAEVEIPNDFTAGTLYFDVDEDITSYEGIYDETNVNPGDEFKKEFDIHNDGTKHMLLRMSLTERWKFDTDHLTTNWVQLGLAGDSSDISTWTTGVDLEGFGTLAVLTNPVDWTQIETDLEDEGWIKEGNWWYYDDVLAPETPSVLEFEFSVNFAGSGMGNEFQGVVYKLIVKFEAIQASNNASGDKWSVESVYDPTDEPAGANWDSWGTPIN